MPLLYAAIIGFVFFLLSERILLWYARKQFALVIHVNGTRGKSTVTRMIYTMLRCQGMEVLGKTTGSAARLLLPNGTEQPVLRFGPANIREQRNIMIKYALKGIFTKKQNKALVFECNAVQEELQYISMKWLKPDITVITNAREDHAFELGNAEQAALVFAAAIPKNSALATSDSKFMTIWEEAAEQKNLRLWYVAPQEAEGCLLPENVACVLAVADCLGINRVEAFESIALHKPDAGAFGVYTWKNNPHRVYFADARAANDVESTSRLFSTTQQIIAAQQTLTPPPDIWRILLLINREDRPDRSELFMRYIINQHKELYFDEYLCLGHTPVFFRMVMKQNKVNYRVLRDIKHFESIMAESRKAIYIFAVGNFGGKGKLVTNWLEAKKHEPDFKALL